MLSPAAEAGGESKRRITHIITGLSRGGAEAILYRLVRSTSEAWESTVISLADEGFYGTALRESGMHGARLPHARVRPVRAGTATSAALPAASTPGRGANLDVSRRPSGWCLCPVTRYPAGIVGHQESAFQQRAAKVHRPAPRPGCAHACWARFLTPSCSASAAAEHRRRGYAGEHMVVIPNGYDLTQLRTDPQAGASVRSAWGVAADEFLIGMVACR